MRRFIMIWITLLALISTALTSVQAAEVSPSITCVEHYADHASIHFGYFASETVNGTGYFGPAGNFEGDLPPNTLDAGQHDDVFTVEVYGPASWQFVGADGFTFSLDVDVDTTGPDCDALSAQWHPGAVSIPITLASDCAWIEINNHDGGWSRVTSDGEPVLLHYGEALIGGPNQSSDPADYRAVATACY